MLAASAAIILASPLTSAPDFAESAEDDVASGDLPPAAAHAAEAMRRIAATTQVAPVRRAEEGWDGRRDLFLSLATRRALPHRWRLRVRAIAGVPHKTVYTKHQRHCSLPDLRAQRTPVVLPCCRATLSRGADYVPIIFYLQAIFRVRGTFLNTKLYNAC